MAESTGEVLAFMSILAQLCVSAQNALKIKESRNHMHSVPTVSC
jgi:hypothetical protein